MLLKPPLIGQSLRTNSFCNQILKFICAHRFVKAEPLHEIASKSNELQFLLCSLNSFSYYFDPEPVRKIDDRSDDLKVLAAIYHADYERSIDLDCIDREAGKVFESRKYRTEIVQRQSNV